MVHPSFFSLYPPNKQNPLFINYKVLTLYHLFILYFLNLCFETMLITNTCLLYTSVTLMGNNGQWIEVQIRSERMNDVAEQGFAAHWKYKEGGGSEDEGELEKWLKTIKEILDDPQPDAIDVLDTIKLNRFASEIDVYKRQV